MLSQLRRDGRALATRVGSLRLASPIVLAIPRRGVVVAAEIARELHAPLDVVLVAKVGIAERVVGALALGGERVEDAPAIAALSASRAEVDAAFADAHARLEERLATIRADAPLPDLQGRTIVLVDDAVVTGLTIAAAIDALARRKVGSIIVATPLASEQATTRLGPSVYAWIALERTREVDADARHAEASNRICPPIADEELRQTLLVAWRVAHEDLGGLELDGI